VTSEEGLSSSELFGFCLFSYWLIFWLVSYLVMLHSHIPYFINNMSRACRIILAKFTRTIKKVERASYRNMNFFLHSTQVHSADCLPPLFCGVTEKSYGKNKSLKISMSHVGGLHFYRRHYSLSRFISRN
jgi:hypothetical protein